MGPESVIGCGGSLLPLVAGCGIYALDGDAKGAPVQGQMIVGVGVSRSAFGEAFGDMGVCV